MIRRGQNTCAHLSATTARKENEETFCLLFSFDFAGFQKKLPARNLPFNGEKCLSKAG